VNTTPGQMFFDKHMSYLMGRDLDRLLEEQYTEDAVLITTFDILDTPPPHIIQAGPKLKEFFAKWLDYHGEMKVDAMTDFTALDDSISFQALMTTQTGKWAMFEAWHLAGEKIDRHYGFARKLD
jgi:hypothetical protein